MNLFYCPDITGTKYILPEEESKHCIRVLRLKPGDEIHITDGRGNMHLCRITRDHPKQCEAEVVSTVNKASRNANRLHIAIAPTKNLERLEWFLEKATEIGIDEVTPLLCEHAERTVIKPVRLEKVAAAAMKQSLKSWLPVIHPATVFESVISKEIPGQKFIAYCETGEEHLLKTHIRPDLDTIILIGPEGDFSPAEVESAIRCGFTPVSLGPNRLRTETAGVVACVLANNGD